MFSYPHVQNCLSTYLTLGYVRALRRRQRQGTTMSKGDNKKPAKPRPRIEARRVSKREAALDGAARLFNERGIAATSIVDVASAMNVTRAALYYYFDERDDLVFQTYERACQIIAGDLEAADEEGDDGLAKTLAFARRALTPERAPVAVLGETEYLKAPQRSIINRASGRNIKALEVFIAQGIEDASVR